MRTAAWTAGLAALALGAGAAAEPPLEAFGALPRIDDMALSPDGRRVALLINEGEVSQFLVQDLESGETFGVDTSAVKARRVDWANDRYALLWASETTFNPDFRTGTLEFAAVFAFDTERRRIVQLLAESPGLSINSSVATVDAVVAGEDEVLMPAFQDGRGRTRALWSVTLRSGRGHVIEDGTPSTRQYVASSDGEAYVRIDYVDRTNEFRVLARHSRGWRTIHEEESATIPFTFAGLLADKSAAVFATSAGRDTRALFAMRLEDGAVTGPLLARGDADLVSVVVSLSDNVVLGAGFADIAGVQYEFLDPALDARWRAAVAAFPNHVVTPRSWSADLDMWLLYVEGVASAGEYVLVDFTEGHGEIIASARPDIDAASIAPVSAIEYRARDGLTISGLLTVPPGVEARALPTVVLPHGGPARHDAYGWDWRAQYLANQGYAVLQPNYRGSDGFGAAFADAARGEWGRAVLDDVTDGVKAMIASGFTDPERVCIVGQSFGGYLALSGAVFTPELYRCAAAIGGVSDVGRMVAAERRTYGGSSSGVSYWLDLARGDDDELSMADISPVGFAENAQAPVLLIHGRDDTVVDFEQSRLMERALERAGKPVELIALRGEDHWLSTSETRIAALRALDGFLREHLAEPDAP